MATSHHSGRPSLIDYLNCDIDVHRRLAANAFFSLERLGFLELRHDRRRSVAHAYPVAAASDEASKSLFTTLLYIGGKNAKKRSRTSSNANLA